MENFQFCISTNVLFGKDKIENMPSVVNDYGKRALLFYGGGSIKNIGIPMTLSELGVSDEHFRDMARHAVETEGTLHAYVPLAENDIIEIYNNCL